MLIKKTLSSRNRMKHKIAEFISHIQKKSRIGVEVTIRWFTYSGILT